MAQSLQLLLADRTFPLPQSPPSLFFSSCELRPLSPAYMHRYLWHGMSSSVCSGDSSGLVPGTSREFPEQ